MKNNDVAGYIDTEHPNRKYYKCQYCGKPFWKPNAFRMMYCSRQCQTDAFRNTHPKKEKAHRRFYIKECLWCGNRFESLYPNQKYCCKECSHQGNLRLKRQQWAEAYVPKQKICKECGTEFMTECGDTHSVFCCRSCAEKSERRTEHGTARHKEYMRKVKARREKQIASTDTGDVSYERVYKRDKGICQICGMPVHSAKMSDDNWDGTIDHIIPLSLGGEHSLENCQLAHRICNSLKCRETHGFTVDWESKALEDNYWQQKLEIYKKLMETA